MMLVVVVVGGARGGVQSYGTHTDEKAALYRDSLDIKGLFVCLIVFLLYMALFCNASPILHSLPFFFLNLNLQFAVKFTYVSSFP